MRRLVIEFKGSSKEVQRGLAVDYRAVVQSVQRYYKQPESCPLPLGKLVALMVAMLKRIAEKRKDYNERDVTVLGDSMSPERAGKGARAAGPRAQQQQHPAPSGARRVLLPPGGAQAGGDGAGAAAAAPPASRTPSPPPVVMGRAARGPHPALRRRRGAEGGAGDLTFDGQGWTTLCLDDDAMFAAHPMRGGKAAATAATKSKNAASAAAAAAPAAGIPAGDDELMLVESPESIPADSPKTTFVRLQRLLNESAYGGEAQVVPALQLSHHAGAGEGGAQHGTPHKEATAEPASNALADGSATATAGEGTESTHAEEAASERQVKEDSPEVDLFSPRRRARHVGSSLTKRIKRRVVTPKMRPVAAPLPESITAVLDSGSASKRKRGSAAPPAGVLLEVPSAGTCAYPFTPPTEATAPPSDTDGTAKCLAAQAPYVLQPATASSLSSSSSHSPIVVNAVASGTPGSGDAVSFGSTPGASPYGALAAAVTAVATVATAPAATRAGKDVASKGAAVGDGDGVPTVITSPDAHPVAATALQTPPRTSPASASASTPRDITSPQSSRGGSTGRTARKRRRADDPPLLGLLGPGGGGSGVKIRKTDKRAGHMPPLLGLFGPAGTPPTMAQANAALPRNPAVWVEGIIPPEDARAGRKPTPLFPEDPAAAALLEGGNPATGVPAITVTAVPAPPQPPLAVKCPIPAPASTATSAAAATTTTPVAAPAAAAQKKALSPLSLPQPPPGAAAVGRLPLPRPPAAPRGGPPGGADANAAAVPGTAACPLVLDGGPASPGKPGGYLGIPGGLAVGAKRKAPASPMDGGLGGGTPLLVPSPGKPLSLDPSGKRRKVIGTGEYSAFTPFGTPRMSPLAAPGTAPLTATTLPEHQDQEMFDTLDPPSFPRIPNVTVVAAPLANFDGRFALHDERQWKTFLLRRGWVIIKDMATTLECEDLISGFWDARATMKTGVSRKDAKTWSNDRWGGNLLTGEWTNDGAGQEPWVWEAREKCAPVFESIYKTNELVTSFDGFEAWRPGYVTKPTAWHVDQAVTNPHFQCIQGFLNLIESGPNDGGFCVASSSKKRFSTLATDCGLHEAKRYQVIPSAAQRHVIGAAFKLNVKQGDFVLFDSRTIHCTQPCPPAHLKQKTHCGLVRLCVNICMLPISLLAKNTADPTVLPAAQAQVRRQAIEEGKTFSHHPGWLCQPPGQRAEGHSKRYHSQALAAYTPPVCALPEDPAAPALSSPLI